MGSASDQTTTRRHDLRPRCGVRILSRCAPRATMIAPRWISAQHLFQHPSSKLAMCAQHILYAARRKPLGILLAEVLVLSVDRVMDYKYIVALHIWSHFNCFAIFTGFRKVLNVLRMASNKKNKRGFLLNDNNWLLISVTKGLIKLSGTIFFLYPYENYLSLFRVMLWGGKISCNI